MLSGVCSNFSIRAAVFLDHQAEELGLETALDFHLIAELVPLQRRLNQRLEDTVGSRIDVQEELLTAQGLDVEAAIYAMAKLCLRQKRAQRAQALRSLPRPLARPERVLTRRLSVPGGLLGPLSASSSN